MNVDEFAALIDRHLGDIRTEALELFAKDVAPDKCVELAIAVLDAKALQKARGMQALLVAAPAMLRRH